MITHLAHTLTLQTPEGVQFRYHLAGPIVRFMAWWIDLLMVITLTILTMRIMPLISVISRDLSQTLSILAFFVISVGYSMCLEWRWQGQTLGKRLFKLRVVDATGLTLQGSQVILRNLMRPVDGLPAFYCLGGLVCLINHQCQRLGDMAAGTLVIREQRPVIPNIEHVLKGKFNSLKAYPHLCARLRQKIPQDLAQLAFQALVRSPQLTDQARNDLFEALSDQFQGLVPFPPHTALGLTPEQHIRNCVEILFTC